MQNFEEKNNAVDISKFLPDDAFTDIPVSRQDCAFYAYTRSSQRSNHSIETLENVTRCYLQHLANEPDENIPVGIVFSFKDLIEESIKELGLSMETRVDSLDCMANKQNVIFAISKVDPSNLVPEDDFLEQISRPPERPQESGLKQTDEDFDLNNINLPSGE